MQEEEYTINTPEGIIHTLLCIVLTPIAFFLAPLLIHDVMASTNLVSFSLHAFFAIAILGIMASSYFVLIFLYYRDIKRFITRPKQLRKWKEEQKLKSFMDKL